MGQCQPFECPITPVFFLLFFDGEGAGGERRSANRRLIADDGRSICQEFDYRVRFNWGAADDMAGGHRKQYVGLDGSGVSTRDVSPSLSFSNCRNTGTAFRLCSRNVTGPSCRKIPQTIDFS